jgi:hypothetical protein
MSVTKNKNQKNALESRHTVWLDSFNSNFQSRSLLKCGIWRIFFQNVAYWEFCFKMWQLAIMSKSHKWFSKKT